jgi:hypothetical protein
MKRFLLISMAGICLAGLVAFVPHGALATITISGSDLNNLSYRPNGGTAQYVPGPPDYALLSTPDAGLAGGAPAAYVQSSTIGGASLGTLSSLSATYSLLSYSGGDGNQPYWLTYLNDPNTGGYIGVVSFTGPTLDGLSQIHVFYDFDPGALSSNTYWGDTLAQLSSTAYGTTTFGNLNVYETGVEIGDWAIDDSIGATAEINSITLSPWTAVPEPSTMLLLCIGLAGAGAYRLRKRAERQS